MVQGVNIKQNVETITNDKPHIIVGTPGRVLDLSNRKHLDLSKVGNVFYECSIQSIKSVLCLVR